MMKKFSNKYMLLYSLALAAVVAALLSIVAMSLKSRQEANAKNEKMQMLLATIGVSCERDEAATLFADYFIEMKSEEGEFTYYIYNKDESHGYVIPMEGKGLWGKIYANVALDYDQNTITGITFSHESETPGLGAEITTEKFRNQFIGKQILDENGEIVSVAVVKNADPANLHQVDAISGGTMTSNGVSAMLLDELRRYVPNLETLADRKEANDGE